MRFLPAAILCGLLALNAGCASQRVVQWSAGEEIAIYASRVEQLFTKGTDGFTPQEMVPGARGAQPLPIAGKRTIALDALTKARRYAEANNSRALLVWRHGALEEESYFKGANVATPIIAKSLAKPLTAIAIGRAISLGYIKSLDQPVSDFITEWRGTPKEEILIRHLLDMRSGLLAQGFVSDPDSIWNKAYLSARHGDILIRDYPLTAKPGRTFAYSNAAADLVALVIERSTKMRYARFLSEKVLGPIGAAGGSVWIDRPNGLAHSGCCISLPAQTWLRLAILLIDDGQWQGRQLLPSGYVAQMRVPTSQNPYYGLGVYLPGAYVQRRGFNGPGGGGPLILHTEPYLTDNFFMFDGNADQVVYIAPSEGVIVMRLGDAPPRAPEWDNSILLNTILRGISPPPAGRVAQR